MPGLLIALFALFALYAVGPGSALIILGVGGIVWQIARDKKRIAQLEKRNRYYY